MLRPVHEYLSGISFRQEVGFGGGNSYGSGVTQRLLMALPGEREAIFRRPAAAPHDRLVVTTSHLLSSGGTLGMDGVGHGSTET